MFSLETLQFIDLLELIAKNAQTEMGERRLLNVRPHTSKLALDRDLQLITETIALAKEDISWSFSDLPESSESIALLKIKNTTLEPLVLREIARLISQALFAKTAIGNGKEFAPTLWEIVEDLPKEISKLADTINDKILPSGELADSASPELNRLRREINAQRERLTKSLESFMRTKGDAVQDDIVTIRNDRYVIPVKAGFSGRIGGVAHGASSSGATVFVEPLESIEANNELQALKAKEENEILRILFSLAEQLRENIPFIENAAEAIAELDFVKAKVVFAREFDAVVPEISNDKTLDLVDARHPLLEESLSVGRPPALSVSSPPVRKGSSESDGVSSAPVKKGSSEIVPVSFSLNDTNSVMIISGANAGGKTVVLKTAGLLSMLAISGLPVPARKATVPFYASVLADIGDHQSLSANLSTFSSHISNIASMMKNLHSPALVLLDEVGTGTDPEEGSALGVAVVDHFRKNGAQVVASTHYKGLKIYAANDGEVINASVEFDEKTLEPTYKLLTGIAGASSGLEIARRFGIRDEVIDNARANLDVAAQEAENYLHKLQKETKQAEDLRIALEEEREATAQKYAKLDIEFRKKEKQRRKEFESELGETLKSFDRKSKTFLKTVEDKKERKKLENELAASRAELKRQAFTKVAEFDTGKRSGSKRVSSPTVRAGSDGISTPRIIEDATISIGSNVYLKNFDKVGKVERIDGDSADVLIGSMRMKQSLEDLEVLVEQSSDKEKPLEKLKNAAKQSNIDLTLGETQSELNLIGKTTMDAESEVDKFLDDSYVSKLQRVRIIHGFGTGALKNSVHQYLKGHPHVDTFGFAPQNEGGNGATIVELKQ